MTVPLSLAARQARLTALRDFIDSGGALLRFYSGTAPAKPEDATAQTLLGTIALASPCGAIGASAATATLSVSVPRVNACDVSGVVGWVRFCKGDGTGVLDVAVVEAPAGGAVVLSDTQVYAGGELQLISCVISE